MKEKACVSFGIFNLGVKPEVVEQALKRPRKFSPGNFGDGAVDGAVVRTLRALEKRKGLKVEVELEVTRITSC